MRAGTVPNEINRKNESGSMPNWPYNGTPTKRQVSKRQVAKRPVSKRQVCKTSGLQNVRL
jgi:hypothetical protein